MAIALVSSGAVSAPGSAASVTPAFGQPTGAGNLLIAAVSTREANTVFSTTSPGWLLAVQTTDPTAGASAAIFYKPNCAAGESAPTLDIPFAQIIYGVAAEFSGAAISTPVDRTAGVHNAIVSPAVATAVGADVAAGELVISSDYDFLSKAGTETSADTFNNGAASNDLGNNDSTSTQDHYRFSYGITTSNALADSVSHANSSKAITAMAVALSSFKVAVVVAPADPVYPVMARRRF